MYGAKVFPVWGAENCFWEPQFCPFWRSERGSGKKVKICGQLCGSPYSTPYFFLKALFWIILPPRPTSRYFILAGEIWCRISVRKKRPFEETEFRDFLPKFWKSTFFPYNFFLHNCHASQPLNVPMVPSKERCFHSEACNFSRALWLILSQRLFLTHFKPSIRSRVFDEFAHFHPEPRPFDPIFFFNHFLIRRFSSDPWLL